MPHVHAYRIRDEKGKRSERKRGREWASEWAKERERSVNRNSFFHSYIVVQRQEYRRYCIKFYEHVPTRSAMMRVVFAATQKSRSTSGTSSPIRTHRAIIDQRKVSLAKWRYPLTHEFEVHFASSPWANAYRYRRREATVSINGFKNDIITKLTQASAQILLSFLRPRHVYVSAISFGA